MNQLKEVISNTVWDIKYRYREGEMIVDQTIEDTWFRVSSAIAAAENGSKQQQYWQNQFYRILQDFRFLPGGRILAGAGTHHQVTLFNCFVMDIKEDSLRAIFDALEEGALTLQQGGGIGYDFSILRPNGDPVKKIGVTAGGPVSFMRIWDTMCSIMLSTGARRGAMMAVLRCDHPDIFEFIKAKRDSRELRHFNVSVMISDAFMQAVKEDKEWALIFPADQINQNQTIVYRQWGKSKEKLACQVYRLVKARELWDLIIQSAYEYAEPGVLFSDTINRQNTLWYREQINATNPCGEIPLPAYGACNLGSINLTQFVNHAFQKNASVKWNEIEEVTRIATRFLDNVIDVSRYPLPIQQQEAFNSRRIGLGITGLADLFVMLGLRYGSREAIQLAKEIMKRIADITWFTSVALAQEKGRFPYWDKAYLQGDFVQSLDSALYSEIEKHGVRNSHHNTIAPAGTISLLANNISNGIEPIFRAEYKRHMRDAENKMLTFHIKDYAYDLAKKHHIDLKDVWQDTEILTPDAHLQIQGAVQPHIDNAISKTINIPSHFPLEKLTDVYTKAYALGLKGCTIFRPNEVTGSVLEAPEEHCCQFEGERK